MILKKQLDVINQKAASTLSDTEAAVIYCATSTGYHSYQYWMNNHKKWYFALNYPEILEQYNNEELNQFQLKNGKIKTKGWWDDLWNKTENWFNSTVEQVSSVVKIGGIMEKGYCCCGCRWCYYRSYGWMGNSSCHSRSIDSCCRCYYRHNYICRKSSRALYNQFIRKNV